MKPIGYNCIKCDRSDGAADMVKCVDYKKWVHFDCAGVSEDVENQEYLCDLCDG